MSRTGFRLLDPVKSLRQRLDFVRQLHDREALLPRERQRRFLMGEGWVAWPGPAVADFMRQFIAHNRMLQGGFVIEDRTVTLADIDCPVLTVVGDGRRDRPGARRARDRRARRRAPRSTSSPCAPATSGSSSARPRPRRPGRRSPAGRAGGRARASCPPTSAGSSGDEPEPEAPGVGTGSGVGLELAAGVGGGLRGRSPAPPSRTAGGVRVLAEEVTGQLPRLARLGRLKPGHPRLARPAARRAGAAQRRTRDFFLFEDRAYSHEAVKERIDNVVRGLLSLGVRQGEHVGVLMGPGRAGCRWSRRSTGSARSRC